jgi:hypothetical protein
MNWGNNLTLIGAIDQQGWVALGTQWTAATSESFVAWVRDRLAPKLRAGDIVVLDNLRSYLPGHSALFDASSRRSGAKGSQRTAPPIPGHGFCPLLVQRAVPDSHGFAARRTGRAASSWPEQWSRGRVN